MLSKGHKKGFEIWVERKDGTRFNEHNLQHTTKKGDVSSTTECWLESEDDEIFSIVLRKTDDCARSVFENGWDCTARVDGRELNGGALLAGEDDASWTTAEVMTAEGVMSCDLQFRPHEDTTDDCHQLTIDPRTMDALGQIEVDLERGTWDESQEAGVNHVWEAPDQGPIAEGKMKIGSKVTYAFVSISADDSGINPRPVEDYLWYAFDPHRDGEIWHKFIFKYRPRAVLELMKIIKSTTPDPADSNITDTQQTTRKRAGDDLTTPIDLTQEDLSDDLEGDVVQAREDGRKDKRIRFLEEQLHRQMKRNKTMVPSADQMVDITGDDD